MQHKTIYYETLENEDGIFNPYGICKLVSCKEHHSQDVRYTVFGS